VRSIALAALALAGCRAEPAPQAQPSPSAPASAPVAARPAGVIASGDELVGEYRIAGADDRAVDLPYGMTASISADRIHVTAECINLEWAYRLTAGVLSTRRVTTEGCARGLAPVEQAIADAFDQATAVALNKANGYEFSGGGHSVTLFTQ
jgi:hypothetical protein